MNIIIDTNVLAAFDVLPPDIRKRIDRILDSIRSQEGRIVPGPDIKRLSGDPDHLTVRIDSDLRLLLRQEGGAVRVVDLARKSYA
jgi:hypothetical protein